MKIDKARELFGRPPREPTKPGCGFSPDARRLCPDHNDVTGLCTGSCPEDPVLERMNEHDMKRVDTARLLAELGVKLQTGGDIQVDSKGDVQVVGGVDWGTAHPNVLSALGVPRHLLDGRRHQLFGNEGMPDAEVQVTVGDGRVTAIEGNLPEGAMEQLRARLGGRDFAAEYQQQPAPDPEVWNGIRHTYNRNTDLSNREFSGRRLDAVVSDIADAVSLGPSGRDALTAAVGRAFDYAAMSDRSRADKPHTAKELCHRLVAMHDEAGRGRYRGHGLTAEGVTDWINRVERALK